ncbi:MAG: transposase, partial [Sumerlaeia bacterium]
QHLHLQPPNPSSRANIPQRRIGVRRPQGGGIFIMSQNLGWYKGTCLPHADFQGSLQSITYRLGDSLPQTVLARVEKEIAQENPEKQESARRKRMEYYLNQGYGSCALANDFAAKIIVNSWQEFSANHYELIAWVVMPNHVHVLIMLDDQAPLGKIVQSWKRFTATRINRALREGVIENKTPNIVENDSTSTKAAFWERDYWDRFIRYEQHFVNTIDYIHNNPVKAGLVQNPEHWPHSSAALWKQRIQN